MTDTIQDRLRRTTPARDAAFGVVGQMPVNPDGPEAAAHIDAQDAKIKALVEAGNLALKEIDNGTYEGDHTFPEKMRSALAAAKETT